MFAAEGFTYLLVSLLLLTASGLTALIRKRPRWLLLTAIFAVLYVMLLIFFRDPARPKPPEDAIVAPTDGRVLSVHRQPDGRTMIDIYLNLFNVHAVRSPATGLIDSAEYRPGRFWRAFTDRAGRENQRVRVQMKTAQGPLLFEVLTGALTRRVIVPVKEGQELIAGQRIGFIRFGSRSRVLLPPGVEATVRVDETLVGGVSEIGRIVTPAASADTLVAEQERSGA